MDNRLYPEEKEEIKEALDKVLEIYFENLNDYKRWNKIKENGFMSDFNQEECDEKIKYYIHKIEVVRRIKAKIGV